MIERIRPRKIVCRADVKGRRRRVVAATATLLAAAALPMLHGAQASRRSSPPAPVVEVAHAEVPGAITLAEMIERQRARRVQPTTTSHQADDAGWEVQYGAFSARAPAYDLHERLTAVGLGKDIPIAVVASDGLFRVRSLTEDAPAAEAACAAAQAAGVACFTRRR